MPITTLVSFKTSPDDPYGTEFNPATDRRLTDEDRRRNGLREGDIVLSVNQVPVTDPDELLRQVNRLQSAVLLHVLRGNSAAFIVAR